MHSTAFKYVQATKKQLGIHPSLVIEIGSRNVNGSVRSLFEKAERYIGLDLIPGPQVDIVADGSKWLPDTPADLVVTVSTLEHAPQAAELIANSHRMLKEGGYLILTTQCWPFPVHSGMTGETGKLYRGEYYHNVEPDELQQWLTEAGYSKVSIDTSLQSVGDLFCWAQK